MLESSREKTTGFSLTVPRVGKLIAIGGEVENFVDVQCDFAICTETSESAAGGIGVAGRATSVTVLTGREGGRARLGVGVPEDFGASTREGVVGAAGERWTLPLESKPGKGTLVS